MDFLSLLYIVPHNVRESREQQCFGVSRYGPAKGGVDASRARGMRIRSLIRFCCLHTDTVSYPPFSSYQVNEYTIPVA